MEERTNWKNPFGQDSILSLEAAGEKENTYLKEIFFTAPFKVMTPFEGEKGRKEVMVLTASAGIMEGDAQKISIRLLPGAELSVTSQAFEKIHKMKDGFALRKTKIEVGQRAFLSYCPLPVIPFAESAFENETRIFLEDESSRLIYEEILSCGRAARGERFQYRFYNSLIEAWCKEELIYRENVRFHPSSQPMEDLGFFEGYSHMASLVFFHMDISEEKERRMRKLIENGEEIRGGVTRTGAGDVAVRMFGRRAQRLQEACEELKKMNEADERK